MPRHRRPRRSGSVVVVALVVAVVVTIVALFALGSRPGRHDVAITTTSSTASTTTSPPPSSTCPTTTSTRPSPPPAGRPLTGDVVVLDPGHNGHNYLDPGYVDHLIWNGREHETCNTTGTATDGGYTEAQFNFNVALAAAADLRRLGATVVLTRHTNTGVGPCVNVRAAIGNRAHARVVVAIHADGGPQDGRGFTILTPVADGINDRIVEPSSRFAVDLRTSVLAHTSMPLSDYDGVDGIQPRDDLAGSNLSTVPMVFLECGNMRNATDARLLVTGAFQHEVATAITVAIVTFLRRTPSGRH